MPRPLYSFLRMWIWLVLRILLRNSHSWFVAWSCIAALKLPIISPSGACSDHGRGHVGGMESAYILDSCTLDPTSLLQGPWPWAYWTAPRRKGLWRKGSRRPRWFWWRRLWPVQRFDKSLQHGAAIQSQSAAGIAAEYDDAWARGNLLQLVQVTPRGLAVGHWSPSRSRNCPSSTATLA